MIFQNIPAQQMIMILWLNTILLYLEISGYLCHATNWQRKNYFSKTKYHKIKLKLDIPKINL